MSDSNMSEPLFNAPPWKPVDISSQIMKNKFDACCEMNEILSIDVKSLVKKVNHLRQHTERITEQLAEKNQEAEKLKQAIEKWKAFDPLKKFEAQFDEEQEEKKMEDEELMKTKIDLSEEQLSKLEDVFQKKLELDEELAKTIGVDSLVLVVWIRGRQLMQDLSEHKAVMRYTLKRLNNVLKQAPAHNPSTPAAEPCQDKDDMVRGQPETAKKVNENSSLENDNNQKKISALKKMVEHSNKIIDECNHNLRKFRTSDDAKMQRKLKEYFDFSSDDLLTSDDPEKIKRKWQQENPLVAVKYLEGELFAEQMQTMKVSEPLSEIKKQLDVLVVSPDEFQAQTLQFQETIRKQAEELKDVEELKEKLASVQSEIQRRYQPTLQRQASLFKDYEQCGPRVEALRQKERHALREEKGINDLFRRTQRERDAVVEKYRKIAEEHANTNPNMKKIDELKAQLDEKTKEVLDLEEANLSLNVLVNECNKEYDDGMAICTELRVQLRDMISINERLQQRNEQLEAEAQEYDDEEMEEDE